MAQQFTGTQPVQHVFVLMLENHSFDHLLGFSGITGTDAVSGQATRVNGLTGNEQNSYKGQSFSVKHPTGINMPVDPGHEFTDTLGQLAGHGAVYHKGSPYPSVNNSGFVASYAASMPAKEVQAHADAGEIMKCFGPEQLPVLNALAREFAVCDHWFSSIPGPTWPNRFFVHAASSGGLDHSPTMGEIAAWEGVSGIRFQHGTVFDRLNQYKSPWRLYRGDRFLNDSFPNVAALKGIHSWDTHAMSGFEQDVCDKPYPYLYTFIEPSYGNILNNTYKGGTSQHPLDDITGGELLIKQVYEVLRKSPIWEKSMLLILWDEHGGFYDHVAPPAAIAPGDTLLNPPGINQYGFDFTQYGVRVPAVVVSPWIARNVIDHRLYDHASVPATLAKLFNFQPLTQRDAHANHLLPLLTLKTARTDAPYVLPDAVVPLQPHLVTEEEAAGSAKPGSANKGSLPGFLHAALQSDLKVSPQAEHPAILAHFKKISTQRDAKEYMQTVQTKVQANLTHKKVTQ